MANEISIKVRILNEAAAGLAEIRAQVKELARELSANARKDIDIVVDSAEAKRAVATTKAELASIPNHVDVTVDVNKGGSGSLSSLGGDAEKAGAQAGNLFTKGMTSAVGEGFSMWQGIFVSAVAAGPLIGAAIVGAIALAIASGGIAVALYKQFNSPKVKASFDHFKDALSSVVEHATAPLAPAFAKSFDIIGRLIQNHASDFDKFFEGVGKIIPVLTDGLAGFFVALVGPLADFMNGPVMKDFMTQISGFLETIGGSLARFFQTIDENPDVAKGLTMSFQALLATINFVLNLVLSLIVGFAFLTEKAGAFCTFMVGAMSNLKDAAVLVWNSIASAASGAWNWIVGIFQWASNFISSGIGNLGNYINSIWSWVANSAQSAWNWIVGIVSNAVGRINSFISTIKSVPGNILDSINPFGRASGGVIGGMAGGGVRRAYGGVTLVGEAGPELVRLPYGSQVRTNGDSRRELGATGDDAIALDITVRSDDGTVLEQMRRIVGRRGGNVQLALGR